MHQELWSRGFEGFEIVHRLDVQPENSCLMHTHDVLEIYYFISGNCTYLIEGTAYPLQPHDILFKRPLEAHKLIVNSPDVPYERIGITLPITAFQSVDPDNTLFAPMMARPLGSDNRFTSADFGHNHCADLMQYLSKHGAELDTPTLTSMVLFICSEASRVLRTRGTTKRQSDAATRLIDYINQHLFTDISLEKVSHALFLSQSQINRILKSNTGSSLRQYVTIKRLLTARDRIRSGATANEACYECGYNDYSAFYRAYVKQFGHAPQEDKR